MESLLAMCNHYEEKLYAQARAIEQQWSQAQQREETHAAEVAALSAAHAAEMAQLKAAYTADAAVFARSLRDAEESLDEADRPNLSHSNGYK